MDKMSETVLREYADIESLDSKELFKIYQENKDTVIRDILIGRYLYIAEILSKKYVNKGIDYDDIYQVASLGLIYAVQRYDLSKGYEFSSFATPTIIGEIKKYFRDKGWAIRVPRRIQELSKKVNNAKIKLQQDLQRTPKVKDIAIYLDVTEEEVLEALEAGYVYAPKSLDITYDNNGDDKDVQFKDIIGSDDKNFSTVEYNDFIKDVLTKFNDIEKKIINDRFFENKTQSQVAKELDVSQMTISRMEKKIIGRFRSELEKVNNV